MTRVVETGDIYFVYRPRSGAHRVRGIDDLEAVYMILHPYGHECYRLLHLARPTLPETSDVGRELWAIVESVGRTPEDVEDQLDLEVWGIRGAPLVVRPTARPAGEGVYGIVRHDAHTHLAYVLELPPQRGPVQRDLHIELEASYLISVRDPRLPSRESRGWEGVRTPNLPLDILGHFRDRRVAPLDPPRLLDYEGVEVLLAAAGDEVLPELGMRIDLEKERAETADVFQDLRLERSTHRVGPLLKGEWE